MAITKLFSEQIKLELHLGQVETRWLKSSVVVIG